MNWKKRQQNYTFQMELISSHFRKINGHVCFAYWSDWLDSLVMRGTWPSFSWKWRGGHLSPRATRSLLLRAVRKSELIAASPCRELWVRTAARWWWQCSPLPRTRTDHRRTHAMGQDEDLERLMGHLGQYQTLHFFITIFMICYSH